MRLITIFTICLLFKSVGYCQDSEMDKFYTFYKIPDQSKKPFDSIYKGIQQRRDAFAKAYDAYKEKNGNLDGFSYNWKDFEAETINSLKGKPPVPLKELLYYSYFDLGANGAFGLALNPDICIRAMQEIKPTSVIWAMNPASLYAVITATGGGEKNVSYLNDVIKQNEDKFLRLYVKNNLAPDRALKNGNIFPEFNYVQFKDTTAVLSTVNLRGKYYLVDIWATFCEPCIDEFPNLKKEFERWDRQKIDFISISIDSDIDTPLKFLKDKVSLPWTTGISIP